MEAATGERIVAFGRVGKPLEKGVFSAPSTPRGDNGMQRILKPQGVGLCQGNFRHGFAIEQKARVAQIIESARVDYARGRFCRAAVRGAGSVRNWGEGHDR